MAKLRSEWSTKYRKRIEAAEARAKREGKTFSKQAARGHSSGEGKKSKSAKSFREMVTNLSARQMTEITKFFQTLNPSDQTQINKTKLVLLVDEKGWEWFRELRATRKNMLKLAKQGPIGFGVWRSLFADLELEDRTDVDWLLYYGGI